MALYIKTQEKINLALADNKQRLGEVLSKFFTYVSDKEPKIEEVAKELRLTKKTIYNWLQFKTYPTRETLNNINDWLENRLGD